MSAQDLGRLIKTARRVRRLNRPQLSAKCGVNYGMIEELESGRAKKPSFANVVAIADALGLSLEKLAAEVRKKT